MPGCIWQWFYLGKCFIEMVDPIFTPITNAAIADVRVHLQS